MKIIVQKEVWVARNKGKGKHPGFLYAYKNEPIKKMSFFEEQLPWDEHESIVLDTKLYPEVTFENSPQKVIMEFEESDTFLLPN